MLRLESNRASRRRIREVFGRRWKSERLRPEGAALLTSNSQNWSQSRQNPTMDRPNTPSKTIRSSDLLGSVSGPATRVRFLEGSVVRPMDLNQKRPATETGGSLITPRSPKHALVRATELNGRERLAGEPRNIVPDRWSPAIRGGSWEGSRSAPSVKSQETPKKPTCAVQRLSWIM